MTEAVILALVALASSGLTQGVNFLRSRSKTEQTLTLQARETLMAEAKQIREDLRLEIAGLRKEVQTLRDENILLRRERMEMEDRHREELARIDMRWQTRLVEQDAEWRQRYGTLETAYAQLLRGKE